MRGEHDQVRRRVPPAVTKVAPSARTAGSGVATPVLIAALIAGTLWIAPLAAAQARPRPWACQPAESSDACFRRGLQLAEEAGNVRKGGGNTRKADALELEALALLRSACTRDEGDACYFAGRLVAMPRGWTLDANATRAEAGDSAITASLAEAARLFRKGCYSERRPSAAACTGLGDSYTFGLGQAIQLDSAIKILERGCALKSDIACYRWASRLEEHPELGPQRRVLAYELAQKACASGSPTGCVNVAYVTDTALFNVSEAQLRTAAYQRKAQMVAQLDRDSCKKWIAIGCNNVGALFSNGRYGVPPGLTAAQRLDSARYYFTLACEGVPVRVVGRDTTRALGHGFACRNLGNLLLSAIPPDTAAALVQYRRGCLLFEKRACAELALQEYMFHHDSADVALLRSVTACNEGLGLGCNYAAWLLRQPVFDEPAQSLVYFRRACDLDYGWSCYRLGELESTAARKAKYHRRACGLLDGNGCFGLASLLEKTFSQPDRALIFYERACVNYVANGCWEAKRIHRARNDLVNEGLDRARACRLDKTFCKKPDPSS